MNYEEDIAMKKILSLSSLICMIMISVNSVSAETPIYNDFGELIGYEWSEDELNIDKFREEIGKSEITFSTDIDGIEVIIEGTDSRIAYFYDNELQYCSLRPFAEEAGYTALWDGENQFAVFTKDDIEIKATVGENFIVKNSEYIKLNGDVFLYKDRVCIPFVNITDVLSTKLSQ